MSTSEEDRRTAATYVLGTLDAEERVAARAWMSADPAFAALVRLWEDRLAPLHELSPAVHPPHGLLDEILAALPSPAAAESEALPTVSADASEVIPPAAVDVAVPVEAPSLPIPQEGPRPLDSGPPEAVSVSPPSAAPAPSGTDAEPADGSAADVAAAAEAQPVACEPVAEVAAPSSDILASVAEGAVSARARPSEPAPAPEYRDPPRNPWRVATGLLMLAAVFAGAAFAYRELHRQQPSGLVAVLQNSPDPALTLSLDPDAGDVTVRQIGAPPPQGMIYKLWLVSHRLGTRQIAAFRAPGQFHSDILAGAGRAGLAGALLQATLEPESLDLAVPTGRVVFHGRVFAR